MTETVAAFERHLLDNLDDVAAWSAYADYLTEQGEPRGDFMRVQLALEDESLPKAERRALQEEEEALRVKHLDEWVGEKFAFAQEYYGPNEAFTFRRGWLWGAAGFEWEGQTDASTLTAWRWLHTLDIGFCEARLAYTPLVRNLRSLRVGDDETHGSTRPENLAQMVVGAARLEQLYLACLGFATSEVFAAPLNRLRELHLHCQEDCPTAILATNPTFAGLETIAFHPHAVLEYDDDGLEYDDRLGSYLTAATAWDIAYSPHLKRLEHLQLNCCNAGDEGIDLLVQSGLIRRLKSLDLRHGCVTDAGARTLFNALDGKPHALQVLKLGDNALTGDGVAALRRLKLTFGAPDQHDPGDDTYLTQGDFE